jgi:hypothetical protein
MKRFWYKSYVADILSQERMRLPDWLFRRLIEFEAFAAEFGDDGLLPPVKDMAWILRPVAETKLSEALQGLSEVGEVELTPNGWRLTHFEERQRGEAYARVKKHRERNAVKRGETDETRDSSSLSSSDSDSGGEGAGRGGKPPPRSAADAVAVSEFLDQGDGRREAQSLLLDAASLAALPPAEYPRVEQVRAMITTYGAEKTLAGLRAQRSEWCKNRGPARTTVGHRNPMARPLRILQTLGFGGLLARLHHLPAAGAQLQDFQDQILVTDALGGGLQA